MIGGRYNANSAHLTLNNLPLRWVDKMEYLGVSIRRAKQFEVDFSETRRKFFVSVNSILYHSKFSCDLVKLQLIESHCLSILTYAMDCLNTPNVKLF